MFFPFTGGSRGSNFGQKAWIWEFVGKHPQKSKTGDFSRFSLLTLDFYLYYLLYKYYDGGALSNFNIINIVIVFID
jgi:hypothetical protein